MKNQNLSRLSNCREEGTNKVDCNDCSQNHFFGCSPQQKFSSRDIPLTPNQAQEPRGVSKKHNVRRGIDKNGRHVRSQESDYSCQGVSPFPNRHAVFFFFCFRAQSSLFCRLGAHGARFAAATFSPRTSTNFCTLHFSMPLHCRSLRHQHQQAGRYNRQLFQIPLQISTEEGSFISPILPRSPLYVENLPETGDVRLLLLLQPVPLVGVGRH